MRKKDSLYIGLAVAITFLVTACGDNNYDTAPGLTITKTRADYFENVCVGMYPDSEIWHSPSYGTFETKENWFDLTDTTYLRRLRLIDGYVLAGEINNYGKAAFLSLTIKQWLEMEYELNSLAIPRDTVYKYLLDTDPFTEYYYDSNRPRKYEMSDTAEINDIIRNGELDKYFTALHK
ncbi:MAG: hypothetical protein K9H26_00180 [Prolixibacteraceae bacterium]|nr:hypothetical protein [Prolixibacteraceae bacterium]